MPKITRMEIKTEQELILGDLPQVTALAFKFIQFVGVVPNQRGERTDQP